MNKVPLKELLELSPEERLQLIGDLWDSLEDTDLPPLSEAWKKEIDRRWKEHQKNPGSAVPWEEVRARLWARYK